MKSAKSFALCIKQIIIIIIIIIIITIIIIILKNTEKVYNNLMNSTML